MNVPFIPPFFKIGLTRQSPEKRREQLINDIVSNNLNLFDKIDELHKNYVIKKSYASFVFSNILEATVFEHQFHYYLPQHFSFLKKCEPPITMNNVSGSSEFYTISPKCSDYITYMMSDYNNLNRHVKHGGDIVTKWYNLKNKPTEFYINKKLVLTTYLPHIINHRGLLYMKVKKDELKLKSEFENSKKLPKVSALSAIDPKSMGLKLYNIADESKWELLVLDINGADTVINNQYSGKNSDYVWIWLEYITIKHNNKFFPIRDIMSNRVLLKGDNTVENLKTVDIESGELDKAISYAYDIIMEKQAHFIGAYNHLKYIEHYISDKNVNLDNLDKKAHFLSIYNDNIKKHIKLSDIGVKELPSNYEMLENLYNKPEDLLNKSGKVYYNTIQNGEGVILLFTNKPILIDGKHYYLPPIPYYMSKNVFSYLHFLGLLKHLKISLNVSKPDQFLSVYVSKKGLQNVNILDVIYPSISSNNATMVTRRDEPFNLSSCIFMVKGKKDIVSTIVNQYILYVVMSSLIHKDDVIGAYKYFIQDLYTLILRGEFETIQSNLLNFGDYLCNLKSNKQVKFTNVSKKISYSKYKCSHFSGKKLFNFIKFKNHYEKVFCQKNKFTDVVNNDKNIIENKAPVTYNDVKLLILDKISEFKYNNNGEFVYNNNGEELKLSPKLSYVYTDDSGNEHVLPEILNNAFRQREKKND
jgi:hypothetical protein